MTDTTPKGQLGRAWAVPTAGFETKNPKAHPWAIEQWYLERKSDDTWYLVSAIHLRDVPREDRTITIEGRTIVAPNPYRVHSACTHEIAVARFSEKPSLTEPADGNQLEDPELLTIQLCVEDVEKCGSCKHPAHLGNCTHRLGGTAYACMCARDTVRKTPDERVSLWMHGFCEALLRSLPVDSTPDMVSWWQTRTLIAASRHPIEGYIEVRNG